MSSGYFEDIEVGDSQKAGPILSLRTKSFSSPKSMTRDLSISMRQPRLVLFLRDFRHLLPILSRSSTRSLTNFILRSVPLPRWAMMS